jgi:hypothetical protein
MRLREKAADDQSALTEPVIEASDIADRTMPIERA